MRNNKTDNNKLTHYLLIYAMLVPIFVELLIKITSTKLIVYLTDFIIRPNYIYLKLHQLNVLNCG